MSFPSWAPHQSPGGGEHELHRRCGGAGERRPGGVGLRPASRRSAPAAGVSIACSALLNVPLAVAERAALQLLRAAAGREQDLGAAHVAAVLDLAEQGREDAGSRCPTGLIAAVHSGVLTICRASRPPAAAVLERDRPLRWGGYTLTLLGHRRGNGLALRPGEEPVQTAACEPGTRLHLPGTNGARASSGCAWTTASPLRSGKGCRQFM